MSYRPNLAFPINYILNPKAEIGTGTNGWATYDDGSSSTPVDGTGGSPGVTWTQTTASPLAGQAEFLFTHDAADRLGEGVSYDFTIDRASRFSVLQIQFDYEILSGTYDPSDGTVSDLSDLTVWVYDVTNATLIQPTPYKLVGSVIGQNYKFRGEFQTTSSTSYRLIIHCSMATATAYTVGFDNFVVGPSNVSAGSLVTDWTAFTPSDTTYAWATTSSRSFFWKRNGDSISVRGEVVLSSVVSASITFGPAEWLPPGLSVDSSKFGSNYCMAGTIQAVDSSASSSADQFNGVSYVIANGTILFVAAAGVDVYDGAAPFTWASGDYFSFVVENIPITGWASSSVASQDTDQRVVAAVYEISASTANSSIADNAIEILDYDTKRVDTHGAVTTGASWKFTAPVPGVYDVTASFVYGNVTNLSTAYFYIYKNAALYAILDFFSGTSSNQALSGNAKVQLNAGDYIDVRAYQDDTAAAARSISTSANQWQIAINRLSGPEQILASEAIIAAYNTITAQSVTNNTYRFVDFETKIIDTHGAVAGAGGGISSTGSSAWRFVCPAAGKYFIKASFYLSSGGGWAAGEDLLIRPYLNGSAYTSNYQYWTMQATHAAGVGGNQTAIVEAKAGDYITMAIYQNSGAAINIGQGAIDIFRIG